MERWDEQSEIAAQHFSAELGAFTWRKPIFCFSAHSRALEHAPWNVIPCQTSNQKKPSGKEWAGIRAERLKPCNLHSLQKMSADYKARC